VAQVGHLGGSGVEAQEEVARHVPGAEEEVGRFGLVASKL